jgi:hypothetical protein
MVLLGCLILVSSPGGQASLLFKSAEPMHADASDQAVKAVASLARLRGDFESLEGFAASLKVAQPGLNPSQAAALAASGPVAPNHLGLVKEADAILTDASLSTRGFELARAATSAQADALGIELVPTEVLAHAMPSAAILSLADSVGVPLATDQQEQARALDAEPSARAIARVIDAYAAMNAASTHAFTTNPDHPLWGETLSARLALLDAIQGLEPFALPAHEKAAPVGPTFGVPGLLAVDLGNNNVYRDNYALSIDLGGNDEYDNNGGGNTFGDCGMFTTSAAAIDVGGTDVYAPAWNHGTDANPIIYADSCGKNGGSVRGVGFLFHEGGMGNQYAAGQSEGINGGAEGPAALGFLLSVGGSGDMFNAGSYGVNGGADDAGVGALVEAGLSSASFHASGYGANGGANSGNLGGSMGMLIDATNGYHAASGDGSNGGAEGLGTVGFAFGGGQWDDGWDGANGGGARGGAGTLVGATSVTAGGVGVNGGADGTGSTGSLWGVQSASAYGDEGTNGGGSNGGHGTLVSTGCSCSAGGYGANGGGYNFGSGFLYDALGGTYWAEGNGANGGGDANGVGMLLVSGLGGTAFFGGSEGVNGGGHEAGLGHLINAGAADATFQAGNDGVNGGASVGGYGGLINAAGNDHYTAGDDGTNGGATSAGTGHLVDLAGNDDYTAGANGANGGATLISSAGLLLDAQGHDTYSDGQGGTGTDKTVLQKNTLGAAGAQIDVSPI